MEINVQNITKLQTKVVVLEEREQCLSR